MNNIHRSPLRPLHLFRRAIALALPCWLLTASIPGGAGEAPTAVIVGNWVGDGLTLQQGNRRSNQVRQGGRNVLEYTGVLRVPGDNRSWASLLFATRQVWEYGGLQIHTNRGTIVAEYRFPCDTRGGLTIGWRPFGEKGNRDRACNEGMHVGPSKTTASLSPTEGNLAQANKSLLQAQRLDEALIVPGPERTVISTDSRGSNVDTYVLEGSVRASSTRYPQPVIVRAGEKYSSATGAVTPFDRNALLRSPAIQDFLNPAHWSSPNVPQRIADEAAQQLADHRQGLGQPPVAGQAPRTGTPRTVQLPLSPGTDNCLSFAQDCNEAAADYLCKQAGHAGVFEHTARPAQQTVTVVSRETCSRATGKQCHEFSSITCLAK